MKLRIHCRSILLLLLGLGPWSTAGFLQQPLYQSPRLSTRKSQNFKNSPVGQSMSSKRLPATSATSDDDSSKSRRWTKLITGIDQPQRPDWARPWMPTWLLQMRPSVQLLVTVICYIFHMTVLAQHSIAFPIQLIPNERGHFQSIGWDSLAGMACLGAYHYFRTTSNSTAPATTSTTESGTDKITKSTPVFPKIFKTPSLQDAPWRNIYRSKYSRITSFLASCALLQAYLWTGKFSLWWEDVFYYLANFYPVTIAMHRSLCVLFGHLTWIVLGGSVLRLIPRPQDFFDRTWYTQQFRQTQWVWWTVGGFYVSSWLFNIADFVNQWVLPVAILEQAQESVVSQLINPESNDWWASFVGYIAPCVTAPWWEEVLYRGFLLPALILQMPYKWAVLWSGIIFSVHHLSPTACIPLAVLGWTWSLLYAKSGNLVTTILVHAMWNSRIFLGSWLGL